MPQPAYPPAPALTQALAFGGVHLLPAERRLLVQGQPAPLGARAFDLLLALAARRERVVSKDELLDVVWPGVVVEENNLAAQISALRKVLGAQAISTVPGRGYRFTLAPGGTLPSSGGQGGPALLAAAPGGAGFGATPVASRPDHPAAVPAAQASMRLLLAEDNKVNRLLLSRTLELQGWQVSTADNGRQALELLRQQPFALLLLDLEMPELDGFALLQQRSEDAALRRVPVIVTSSLDGVGPVARCIELGADDYLHKPVNATLLRTRVGACLERQQLRAERDELLLQRAQQAGQGGGLDSVGTAPGWQRRDAAVLVLRLRELDPLLQAQAPEDTQELLNNWHTLMLDAVQAHAGQLQQATGDSLTVLFMPESPSQAPSQAPSHAQPAQPAPALAQAALRAVHASREMADLLRLFNAERSAAGRLPLQQGAGLACGTVLLGATGTPAQPVHACLGAAVQRARSLALCALPAGCTLLLDAGAQQGLAGHLDLLPLPPARLADDQPAVAPPQPVYGAPAPV